MCSTELNFTTLFLNCDQLYCALQHCTCVVLNCTALYSKIFLLCSTVLHFKALYLYCAQLYSTLQHCTCSMFFWRIPQSTFYLLSLSTFRLCQGNCWVTMGSLTSVLVFSTLLCVIVLGSEVHLSSLLRVNSVSQCSSCRQYSCYSTVEFTTAPGSTALQYSSVQ